MQEKRIFLLVHTHKHGHDYYACFSMEKARETENEILPEDGKDGWLPEKCPKPDGIEIVSLLVR